MQIKIAMKYQFLIPILEIKCQFLKVTIKCNFTWKFKASVFTDRKMPGVSIFSEVFQKSFSFADIFQLCKYYLLTFINVPTKHKRQQGSGEFRIWNVLVAKWRSFQFSTKLGKSTSCLHLKEISPAVFSKTLLAQN